MGFTPCLSVQITVIETIFDCLKRTLKEVKLKQINELYKRINTLRFTVDITELAINITLIKKEPNSIYIRHWIYD